MTTKFIYPRCANSFKKFLSHNKLEKVYIQEFVVYHLALGFKEIYIYDNEEISKKAGIDITQFEQHILNVQDMVTKKVVKKCPEFEGDVDLYLSSIAG